MSELTCHPTMLEAIDFIDHQLDAVVESGSDEELFIASYLQGHYAVIARPLEVQPKASLSDLAQALQSSLQQAFANQELDQADQTHVWALWERLYTHAQDNFPEVK